MSRHILVCAYGFPPLAGPTEYRWLRFVCHLALHGWLVDVLTIRPERRLDYYDEVLLRLVPGSVRVFRVNPGLYEKLVIGPRHHRLRHQRSVLAAGESKLEPTLWDRFRHGLHRLDQTLGALKIPDETFEWIPFAVWRAMRLLRANDYDIIVSSSTPFSSHLVGLAVKKLAKVPWVGDLSDPFAFSPTRRLPTWRQTIDRWLEKVCLSEMDTVVMPVEEMRRAYVQQYKTLDPDKVYVIPYGFAEELYASVHPERSAEFCLVYTGGFYQTIRDPTNFFEALRQVRDLPIEVVLAGSLDLGYQEFLQRSGLSDMVKYIGFQSRERVAALQKGATVLMLLGNKGSLQLPGKIFDYIAASRPILMIKNDEHDLAANLVSRNRLGLVVENKPDSIAKGIRRLFALFSAGKLEPTFELGHAHEFSWSAQACKLQQLLEQVACVRGAF